MPLRIYLFESDAIVALSLFAAIARAPQTHRRYELIGKRQSLPERDVTLPDSDVVILDPAITGKPEPLQVVLSVWQLFDTRVEIILHTDAWALQEYRTGFKEYGVTRGFPRESWKQLLHHLALLS